MNGSIPSETARAHASGEEFGVAITVALAAVCLRHAEERRPDVWQGLMAYLLGCMQASIGFDVALQVIQDLQQLAESRRREQAKARH